MYLLDTNVMSALLSDAPDRRIVKWVDQRGGDCAVPTIAIFELSLGLARLPDGSRKDALVAGIERVIARFGPRIYAFDRAAAEAGGQLSGASERAGRPMSRMDAQIAGIAAVYGLVVVTRNVSDFAGCGISVEDPWAE